jgi:primosomal protein N' (replication factor Y)
MKIVNASPIQQGVLKDVLTYYTSKDVQKNSLVVVPLRGKSVPGLVISHEDANQAKSRLKSSRFALRRVEKVAERNFLLPEFISAAEETACYFAATVGGIISGLVPSRIFEEYLKPKGTLAPFLKKDSVCRRSILADKELHADKFAIQACHEDRFSVYRGIIREEFARGSSVFLSCSTAISTEVVSQELSRGIEQYSFALNGKIPPKELSEKWKKILEMEHPVLIVGTPMFSSIPREDFGAFIVEQESKDSYQTFSRPYFDFRFFLEKFAEKMTARFIIGDSFLRIETLARYEEKKLSAIIPLRFRLLSTLEQAVIDVRKETRYGSGGTAKETRLRSGSIGQEKETSPEKGWQALSEPLRRSMSDTLLAGGNVFLFGVRRGLSPLTACRDCGSILSCPHCQIPYVLHREGARNIFICHKCEERKKTEITCPVCGGWRLLPLGVGVELAAEEARQSFPGVPVFELNADAVKNEKKCAEISSSFKNSRGTILVGTEFALPHIGKTMLAAVVSVDTLFSLPDFRTNEKTLRKLLEVKAKAERTFIVQTRYAEEKIFRALMQGNLMEFYKDEMKERSRFFYPPFSVIIKIRFEGKDEEVAKGGAEIGEMFKKFNVKIFPAFIPKIKDRYQVNAIIKIAAEKWPDTELREKLMSLPPYFKVKVDPEDLL